MLALTCHYPRELKIGHVRARDGEKEHHSSEEGQEHGSHRPENLVREANEARPDAVVGSRVLSLEPRADELHFRLRFFDANRGLQPGDRGEIVLPAVDGVRSELHGDENLALPRGALEIARCDADDGIRRAIENERCLQRLRGGSETPVPKPMAQDHRARSTRRSLLGAESAAQGGLDSQDGEETSGDDTRADFLGAVRALEGHRRRPLPRSRRFEDLARGVIVGEVRDRCHLEHGRPVAMSIPDQDQTLRIAERERAQQNRAEHGKSKAGGGEAEGERCDSERNCRRSSSLVLS